MTREKLGQAATWFAIGVLAGALIFALKGRGGRNPGETPESGGGAAAAEDDRTAELETQNDQLTEMLRQYEQEAEATRATIDELKKALEALPDTEPEKAKKNSGGG